MSAQSMAHCSALAIIMAITLMGCWIQWRWYFIGRVNRWRARKLLKELERRKRVKGLRLHR